MGLIKGSKPTTLDRKPTIDELKKLLNHANILYKAIFFTSVTSGQRIESILKLEIDDIDFLIVTRSALEDDERSNWMRNCTRKYTSFYQRNIKELYIDDPSYRSIIMDNFVLLKEFPSRLDSSVIVFKNKRRTLDGQ